MPGGKKKNPVSTSPIRSFYTKVEANRWRCKHCQVFVTGKGRNGHIRVQHRELGPQLKAMIIKARQQQPCWLLQIPEPAQEPSTPRLGSASARQSAPALRAVSPDPSTPRLSGAGGAGPGSRHWTPQLVERFAREWVKHPILSPEYTGDGVSAYELKRAKCAARRQVFAALGLDQHRPWQKKFYSIYRDMLLNIVRRSQASSEDDVLGAAPAWVRDVEPALQMLPRIMSAMRQEAEKDTVTLADIVRVLWREMSADGDWTRALLAAARTLHRESFLVCNAWYSIRRLSLQKAALSAACGDRRAPPPAALTPAEAVALDLVLLYEPGDRLLTDESFKDYDQMYTMTSLFSLVQQLELDTRDQQHRERWLQAAALHRDRGHTSSLVVLQRRWYEMVEQTRRRLAAFSRRSEDRPPPIVRQIARRYPHLVTDPLPAWSLLVRTGQIYTVDPEPLLLSAARTCSPPRALPARPPADASTTDDDIIFIEKDIETIDLDGTDSDEETNRLMIDECNVSIERRVCMTENNTEEITREMLIKERQDMCWKLETELKQQLEDIYVSETPPACTTERTDTNETPLACKSNLRVNAKETHKKTSLESPNLSEDKFNETDDDDDDVTLGRIKRLLGSKTNAVQREKESMKTENTEVNENEDDNDEMDINVEKLNPESQEITIAENIIHNEQDGDITTKNYDTGQFSLFMLENLDLRNVKAEIIFSDEEYEINADGSNNNNESFDDQISVARTFTDANNKTVQVQKDVVENNKDKIETLISEHQTEYSSVDQNTNTVETPQSAVNENNFSNYETADINNFQENTNAINTVVANKDDEVIENQADSLATEKDNASESSSPTVTNESNIEPQKQMKLQGKKWDAAKMLLADFCKNFVKDSENIQNSKKYNLKTFYNKPGKFDERVIVRAVRSVKTDEVITFTQSDKIETSTRTYKKRTEDSMETYNDKAEKCKATDKVELFTELQNEKKVNKVTINKGKVEIYVNNTKSDDKADAETSEAEKMKIEKLWKEMLEQKNNIQEKYCKRHTINEIEKMNEADNVKQTNEKLTKKYFAGPKSAKMNLEALNILNMINDTEKMKDAKNVEQTNEKLTKKNFAGPKSAKMNLEALNIRNMINDTEEMKDAKNVKQTNEKLTKKNFAGPKSAKINLEALNICNMINDTEKMKDAKNVKQTNEKLTKKNFAGPKSAKMNLEALSIRNMINDTEKMKDAQNVKQPNEKLTKKNFAGPKSVKMNLGALVIGKGSTNTLNKEHETFIQSKRCISREQLIFEDPVAELDVKKDMSSDDESETKLVIAENNDSGEKDDSGQPLYENADSKNSDENYDSIESKANIKLLEALEAKKSQCRDMLSFESEHDNAKETFAMQTGDISNVTADDQSCTAITPKVEKVEESLSENDIHGQSGAFYLSDKIVIKMEKADTEVNTSGSRVEGIHAAGGEGRDGGRPPGSIDIDKLLLPVQVPLYRVDSLRGWRRARAGRVRLAAGDEARLSPRPCLPGALTYTPRTRPLKRSYDARDLALNPDFSLLRRVDAPCSLHRCRPLTVDIDRLPDHVLQYYLALPQHGAGGAGARKKVELVDIDEVRRVNRGLLTAQVRPIAAGGQGQGAGEGARARLKYKDDDDESWVCDGDNEGDSDSDASRSHLVMDVPEDGAGAGPATPAPEDDTLTPEELEKIFKQFTELGSTGSTPHSQSHNNYCCVARRHVAFNKARSRLALRAGRQLPAPKDIHGQAHREPGECECCCLDALRGEDAAAELCRGLRRLQDDLRRLDANTDHVAGCGAPAGARGGKSSKPASQAPRRDRAPGTPHKSHDTKDKRKGKTKKKQDRDYRVGRRDERGMTLKERKEAQEYQEWLNERNAYSKYFTLAASTGKKPKTNLIPAQRPHAASPPEDADKHPPEFQLTKEVTYTATKTNQQPPSTPPPPAPLPRITTIHKETNQPAKSQDEQNVSVLAPSLQYLAKPPPGSVRMTVSAHTDDDVTPPTTAAAPPATVIYGPPTSDDVARASVPTLKDDGFLKSILPPKECNRAGPPPAGATGPRRPVDALCAASELFHERQQPAGPSPAAADQQSVLNVWSNVAATQIPNMNNIPALNQNQVMTHSVTSPSEPALQQWASVVLVQSSSMPLMNSAVAVQPAAARAPSGPRLPCEPTMPLMSSANQQMIPPQINQPRLKALTQPIPPSLLKHFLISQPTQAVNAPQMTPAQTVLNQQFNQIHIQQVGQTQHQPLGQLNLAVEQVTAPQGTTSVFYQSLVQTSQSSSVYAVPTSQYGVGPLLMINSMMPPTPAVQAAPVSSLASLVEPHKPPPTITVKSFASEKYLEMPNKRLFDTTAATSLPALALAPAPAPAPAATTTSPPTERATIDKSPNEFCQNGPRTVPGATSADHPQLNNIINEQTASASPLGSVKSKSVVKHVIWLPTSAGKPSDKSPEDVKPEHNTTKKVVKVVGKKLALVDNNKKMKPFKGTVKLLNSIEISDDSGDDVAALHKAGAELQLPRITSVTSLAHQPAGDDDAAAGAGRALVVEQAGGDQNVIVIDGQVGPFVAHSGTDKDKTDYSVHAATADSGHNVAANKGEPNVCRKRKNSHTFFNSNPGPDSGHATSTDGRDSTGADSSARGLFGCPWFSFGRSAPAHEVTRGRDPSNIQILRADLYCPPLEVQRKFLVVTEQKTEMSAAVFWTMEQRGDCRRILTDDDTGISRKRKLPDEGNKDPAPAGGGGAGEGVTSPGAVFSTDHVTAFSTRGGEGLVLKRVGGAAEAGAGAGAGAASPLAPGSLTAPPDMYIGNKLYKKLTRDPLVYAQVWSVVSDIETVCSLARGGASLALYSGRTGTLLPIQRAAGSRAGTTGLYGQPRAAVQALLQMMNHRAPMPRATDDVISLDSDDDS